MDNWFSVRDNITGESIDAVQGSTLESANDQLDLLCKIKNYNKADLNLVPFEA